LRNLVLVLALACVLWALNAVWLAHDTRPPLWDMAAHQSYALNYLGNAPSDLSFWNRSWNYPPFVHIVIAVFFRLFHPDPHIAVFANLPATFLLFWGVFELARMLAGAGAARWTCVLTALTPYLIWISRETVLDYWLGAWVAVSLVLLVKSDGFQSRSASLLFGLTCALGMLTKWLFAGFLALPCLYVIVRQRIWRSHRQRLHLAWAVLIAAAISGIWYVPNLPGLIRFYFSNTQVGAREGEPPVVSFQSLIYYLRLLEGYQLFALLFCLSLLSCYFVYKNRMLRDGMLPALCIAGGWLALTALRTKDPRFSLPLLGPVMVITGTWIHSWGSGWKSRLAKALVAGVLCIQAYAISFGISWLPPEIVIATGYQGSLRWDWNLYLQHYFHELNAPKREDWKLDPILDRIAEDSRERGIAPDLVLVPDLPRFNSINFQLFARLHGLPSRIDHLQSAQNGARAFDGFNYVLTTEKDQGMSWTTAESGSLSRVVMNERERFRPIDAYPLPNGDLARLYVVLR
jgi:4-amino-4-deoxy-L-arabinose transferase-like glycosyltransferase